MRLSEERFNTMRCNRMQFQYNAIRFNTMQYNIMQHKTNLKQSRKHRYDISIRLPNNALKFGRVSRHIFHGFLQKVERRRKISIAQLSEALPLLFLMAHEPRIDHSLPNITGMLHANDSSTGND